MFHQRSGYRPGEVVASHARRRYRLLPSNPGIPSPDPALFLVHYSKVHGRDALPAASIQVHPQVAQQLQQRRAIQAQGQLARKDFMLHDRSNWPQINAPQGLRGGPGHRRGTSAGNEITVEEEEDVSRGDILDFMTPRDISKMRYEQHHEWMEEVLESPYNIYQILPGDLGLGRKGELEELTKDFFDAPLTAAREPSANGEVVRVGKMDVDKAEDFKRRASSKIAEMQAEIDRMKAKHAKRMVKLQRTTVLNSAERRLRSVHTASSGRNKSNTSTTEQPDDGLDEITSEVESSLGKKIERVANVHVVSKGGLQERHAERTFSTSSATRPTMSPVKATASPAVSQSAFPTQVQSGTPQPAIPAAIQSEAVAKTESNSGSEVPAITEAVSDAQDESNDKTPADDAGVEEGDLPGLDDIGMDIDMDALVNDQDDENDVPAANDWVMVDDEAQQNPGEDIETSAVDDAASEAPLQPAKLSDQSATDQPQESLQDDAPIPDTEEPLDDNDFGGNFDNVDVDTAGDALASYGDDNDDDLNLDAMDDSAFGDAFHPEEDADIS